MFEKYKDLKDKRKHMGMSKREYYKFLFMGLVLVACFVVIALQWGPTSKPKEGTEIGIDDDLPKNRRDMEIRRANDPGAVKKFYEELAKSKRQLEKSEQGTTKDEGNGKNEGDDGKTGQTTDKAAKPRELELPDIPPPPTPWKAEPEIWKQVDDSVADKLEEQVVDYALHELNSMTQEEIDKKVMEDGNIPPSDYTEHPEQFRGKFVSITGTLLTLENRCIPGETRSGVNQIWIGNIYNQRQKNYRKFYFYIFDKHREWVTEQETRQKQLSRNGDLVTLNGIFVKIYRNHTEGGGIEAYPFIVGRRLELTKDATYEESYPWGMLAVVGVLFGGVFLFFFLAMRRDRKMDDEFTQSRKHKRAKLVSNEEVRKAVAKKKIPTEPAGGNSSPGGNQGGQSGPALPESNTESQSPQPGDGADDTS